MTEQEPIDAEVDDEFVELAPDPEMETSGIVIVSPEQYIERTPQRRHSTEVVRQPTKEVAVRVDADDLEFTEDYSILRLLYTKLFRRAINADAELPEMPGIEEEVREFFGAELTDAVTDLDDARDGKTDLDWQLSEWKAAL